VIQLLEAASIVILNDRLDIIPFLVQLGQKTIRTIKLNTSLAIAVKLVFIGLALAGMSQLALAIFADVGVTIIVILISLRLLKWGTPPGNPPSFRQYTTPLLLYHNNKREYFMCFWCYFIKHVFAVFTAFAVYKSFKTT